MIWVYVVLFVHANLHQAYRSDVTSTETPHKTRLRQHPLLRLPLILSILILTSNFAF